jgi:hypothetical protein
MILIVRSKTSTYNVSEHIKEEQGFLENVSVL